MWVYIEPPAVEGEQANFKRKIMASCKTVGWSCKLLPTWITNKIGHSMNVCASRRIHRFLLKCYRRISKEISHHQQVMDQKDMTVLGRRLSTYYAKKPDKIEFLRRAFDESLYCEKITIAMRQLKNGDEVWSAYAGDLLSKSGIIDDSQKVTQAASAIALMVWLVSSKIIDTNSKVYLDYNYGEVSELDLNDLLKHLCKYFPPVKVSSLPRNDCWRQNA